MSMILNLITQQIDRRKCVMWDEAVGLKGGWDPAACTTIISDQSGTTCECNRFGTIAIVAELVEEPTRPPEFLWTKVIH